MNANPTLDRTRLCIRLPRASDVPHIRAIANDKIVHRFTLQPWPYEKRHAVAFVKFARTQFRKGMGVHRLICLKPEMTVVGVIGLSLGRTQDRHGEIWYWLGSAFWNRGYATEAVRLVLEDAFGALKLNRVCAGSVPANTASTAVLERVGFVVEGQLRQHRKLRGRWHDEVRWGVLRGDYKK